MQTNNNKRNLIILLIAGAALYIFRPAISGAVMQPNNSVPYVAPQPIYTVQPTAAPLYTAPDPAKPAQPAQVIIATSEPVLVSIPQPQPVVIDQQPAQTGKDWTEEVTAVNKIIRQATDVVQVCASESIKAYTEIPPRFVDCGPAVRNLELSKQLMVDLQEEIRAGGNQ